MQKTESVAWTEKKLKEHFALKLARSHKHRKVNWIGRRRDVKNPPWSQDTRLIRYLFSQRLALTVELEEVSATAHELHEHLQTFGKKELTSPMFDPRQAGRQAVAQMQDAEGGAWTGSELNEHFGLISATLHKRRKEFRIVWWRDAKSKFHYPKWQFRDNGTLLPGVAEVLQTFGSQDEWRVMRYFLGRRHQFEDQTPLDLLRAGEVEKVVAHAKLHGEENTW